MSRTRGLELGQLTVHSGLDAPASSTREPPILTEPRLFYFRLVAVMMTDECGGNKAGGGNVVCGEVIGRVVRAHENM